jgi:molybdenum cofactor synthesis domain-containing protein
VHGTVIIAIGDELLGGFVLDTNSHWLAQQVRDAGFGTVHIEVVGDQVDAIVAAIQRAVANPAADRVLVCGGIGPTIDDRTLEAVAVALVRPLEVNEDALAHIEGILRRMADAGWVGSAEISDANRRMTNVPSGAEAVLFNRRGMAPGLVYALPSTPGGSDGARWLAVLPGVPRELQALVVEELLPTYFRGATAATVVEVRYRFAVEAEFFEPMRTLEREFPDVSVGSYPQTESRELIIRLRGDNDLSVAAAAAMLREIRPSAE